MFLHFAVGFSVSLERFWHWRRKGLVVSAVSLQEKQLAIKAQIHKNVKNALKKKVLKNWCGCQIKKKHDFCSDPSNHKDTRHFLMMHLFSQNLAHSYIFTFFRQQNVEKCLVFSSRFGVFWYIVLITYFKKLPENIFCSNLFCLLFMWTPWTHLLLHKMQEECNSSLYF